MVIFAFQPANVNAGPIAYAVCQSACNIGWVSCYASAGLVAGTVTGGLGTPFAAIACNVAQGASLKIYISTREGFLYFVGLVIS
ncbi:unnamed protein product [Rhizophagus irregularis]|nr:unnamed protein product [Rhizophagus irregularis]